MLNSTKLNDKVVRTQDNTIQTCLTSSEMTAYLREELDSKSATLIDEHLADCELCCDALEALSTDEDEGLGLSEMEMAVNAFQEQIASEVVASNDEREEAAQVRKLPRSFWRAAAVVLLIASIFWFWQQRQTISGESLFISYFEPYEDLVSTRSGEGPSETRMAAGMELYNAKAFKQAALEFDAILKTGEGTDLTRLYLAISYLSLHRQKEANVHLLQVADGDGAVKDIAEWYLGLSSVKLGDKEAARRHFNKVVKEQGVFAKEAREILEKLD